MSEEPVRYMTADATFPKLLEVTTKIEADNSVLIQIERIPILRLTPSGAVVKIVHAAEETKRLRALGMRMDGSVIWVY